MRPAVPCEVVSPVQPLCFVHTLSNSFKRACLAQRHAGQHSCCAQQMHFTAHHGESRQLCQADRTVLMSQLRMSHFHVPESLAAAQPTSCFKSILFAGALQTNC